MPELPEVQTIVNDLNYKIKGYRVVDFWTDWRRTIKMPLNQYKTSIKGRKILKINRRAKNILIYLSDKGKRGNVPEKIMLIHLKMTGHLLIKTPIGQKQILSKFKKSKLKFKTDKYLNEKVNGYIHHKWLLKKGRKYQSLEFSDLRKFGKIELFNVEELAHRKDMRELGIEPLAKKFTPEKLKEILKRYPQRNIRGILMDLKLIVGIGNIYASEIPFEARLSPKKKAGRMTFKQIKRLHKNIIKVLKKALKMRGTSDSDYRDTAGKTGSFQQVLKVYKREKKKCLRQNCPGVIKREKIGQRSAYYCPKCQKNI